MLSGRCKDLQEKCIAFNERSIARELGNTPQLRMMYQAAVDQQHTLHLWINI